MREDDLAGAAAVAKKAVQLCQPARSAVFQRCGEIKVRRGRPAARLWFDRATAPNPADPHPWVALSNLLLEAGDLEGAKRATEESIRLGTPRGVDEPKIVIKAA